MAKNVRNQPARKWIFMLFVGPGLFFLFYWLIAQGTSETPPEKVPLPEKYNLPGQVVQLDSYEIQAGLPEKNIFTRKLVVGNNNHVMAEAGKIFFIIPVISRNYYFQKEDFILLDARGVQYSPLDVNEQYLSRVAQDRSIEIPGGMPVNYLLFKVKENVKGYYLIMQKNTAEGVWYFEH